jgi:putative ABC transport system substrate-binding protein
MKRRNLLVGAFAFTCATSVSLSVAQTARRKRLGYLSGGRASQGDYTLDILKATLRDFGWRENETIDIDTRWADGDSARLARLASELVHLRPDVIATTGGSEAKAVQLITSDIPIVFHMVADPVSSGLVASISRPGGNTTGFAQGPQLVWSKRLGLLTEMLAHELRHVAWLGNPGHSGSQLNWADAKEAAKGLAIDLVRIDVGRAEELERAFGGVKGLDGLLVQWDFLFAVLSSQIANFAAQQHVPAIYENRAQVLSGGLMSYGGDLRENFRQGASYVDRILKGARPADLPVIQASRFELVLNKGAAKELGLAIPDSLIARADEVIE